jgi:hypothetical protein
MWSDLYAVAIGMSILCVSWRFMTVVLSALQSPDSPQRKAMTWAKRCLQQIWHNTGHVHMGRLPKRGRSVLVAGWAYLTLAFALFALVVLAYAMVSVAVIAGVEAQPKTLAGIVVVSAYFGLGLAVELRLCRAYLRVTRRAWSKLDLTAKACTTLLFSGLSLLTAVSPMLPTVIQ